MAKWSKESCSMPEKIFSDQFFNKNFVQDHHKLLHFYLPEFLKNDRLFCFKASIIVFSSLNVVS